jgi:hypothetical protein
MRIVKEDLWKCKTGTMIVVTTNSTLNKNGALIMGKGAAKQLRDFMPGIDLEIGQIIKPLSSTYGFVPIRLSECEIYKIGIFQTKRYYADNAEMDLINTSLIKLRAFLLDHPDFDVRMNFPGIGAGHLNRDIVEFFLRMHLRDLTNITICHY